MLGVPSATAPLILRQVPSPEKIVEEHKRELPAPPILPATKLEPLQTLPAPDPVVLQPLQIMDVSIPTPPDVLGAEAAVAYLRAPFLAPPTGPVFAELSPQLVPFQFAAEEGRVQQIGDTVYVEEDVARQSLEDLTYLTAREPERVLRTQANIDAERLLQIMGHG